jgi:predicted phage baseplate assembly protein
MKNPLDPTLRQLNDCGCCAGTGAQTPEVIDNRPSLPAIRFRAGVHSQFKATLLAALSSQDRSALRRLRTRASDDFTIALLDAFACTADVLTFYSERIANEAYLRTATERRSVLELARAIGYELAPGVAAGVMLAFTIEGGAGAPGTAIIPKGTKVQSIPGPEEKPQVYETSLEFTARASWNELRPRMTRPQELSTSATFLFFQGTATNLKPGDVLVLATAVDAVAKRVGLVAVDRQRNITRVDFARTPAPVPAYQPPARRKLDLKLNVGPATSNVFQDFFGANTAVSGSVVKTASYFGTWKTDQIVEHFQQRPPSPPPLDPLEGVFILRTRVGFFGHNAPRQESLPKPENTRAGRVAANDPLPKSWDGSNARSIWEDSQGNSYNSDDNTKRSDVFLERVVAEVTEKSWVVFDNAAAPLRPFRVAGVTEESRADYGLSGKCTALALRDKQGKQLDAAARSDDFKTRRTTAYVQSERLDLAEIPISDALLAGQTELPLDQLDFQLQEGQTLALTGEVTDPAYVHGGEFVEIANLRHGDRVTTITFRAGLKNGYVRSTVALNGNVVPATHGETTQEVLGSGDAAQPFQHFALKQKPLTYAFPPDAGQPESSLEIRVDDVKWREAATFYESGPKDRVYIVRRADDGTTTVQFGDGRRGVRLPSGRENVRAVYRKGIGLEGLVKEEQISLMLTQPLGVKGVSNPLSPQGAEDPQSLDDARTNAPRTVLTLDRVVSLQDYEDFARDFPGVDKAHAAWAWAGQTRGVLLTLLGPNGLEISENGQPADPLRTALARQGLPRVPVRIVSRRPSLFAISGIVRVDADRVPSKVEAAVRTAMLDAFSFAAREFGRGVHLSEIIAVIQNVPGVAFIDVTGFQKSALSVDKGKTVVTTTDAVQGYLNAFKPANGGDLLLAEPAELLILDESSLPQLEVESV